MQHRCYGVQFRIKLNCSTALHATCTTVCVTSKHCGKITPPESNDEYEYHCRLLLPNKIKSSVLLSSPFVLNCLMVTEEKALKPKNGIAQFFRGLQFFFFQKSNNNQQIFHSYFNKTATMYRSERLMGMSTCSQVAYFVCSQHQAAQEELNVLPPLPGVFEGFHWSPASLPCSIKGKQSRSQVEPLEKRMQLTRTCGPFGNIDSLEEPWNIDFSVRGLPKHGLSKTSPVQVTWSNHSQVSYQKRNIITCYAKFTVNLNSNCSEAGLKLFKRCK